MKLTMPEGWAGLYVALCILIFGPMVVGALGWILFSITVLLLMISPWLFVAVCVGILIGLALLVKKRSKEEA